MVYLSCPYPFKFPKGCLPKILLGPLLNTWSHIFMRGNSSYIDEGYLVCSRTSTIKLFCENNSRFLAVNCFRKKASSQMFDWVLINSPLYSGFVIQCLKARSNHRRCSTKKAVLRNFTILTEKRVKSSNFLKRETPTGVFL